MHSNLNSLSGDISITADITFREGTVIPTATQSTHALGTILIVVDQSQNEKAEYDRARFHIFHTGLAWVADAIRTCKPDAILVSAEISTEEHKLLPYLRDMANHKGLPLILYSGKFEQRYKSLAVLYSFDDYLIGNITESFRKRIDFFKRLKKHEHIRSLQPRTSVTEAKSTSFKLWPLKRAFDIVVSTLILLAASPVLLIVAILIKLESRGPIFYISKRAGTGYSVFNFYKFRSMRQGADSELRNLMHLNQYADKADSSVFFKLKNDPRITLLGSFLRRSSLDELPQLINVIKGDMSLVGNRPLPLYEAERLTQDQVAWRFLAPAGITGLWQVTKRGKEKMSEEERIDLDIQYAMNSSFLFDLKILLSTIPAMFQKEKV